MYCNVWHFTRQAITEGGVDGMVDQEQCREQA